MLRGMKCRQRERILSLKKQTSHIPNDDDPIIISSGSSSSSNPPESKDSNNSFTGNGNNNVLDRDGLDDNPGNPSVQQQLEAFRREMREGMRQLNHRMERLEGIHQVFRDMFS